MHGSRPRGRRRSVVSNGSMGNSSRYQLWKELLPPETAKTGHGDRRRAARKNQNLPEASKVSTQCTPNSPPVPVSSHLHGFPAWRAKQQGIQQRIRRRSRWKRGSRPHSRSEPHTREITNIHGTDKMKPTAISKNNTHDLQPVTATCTTTPHTKRAKKECNQPSSEQTNLQRFLMRARRSEFTRFQLKEQCLTTSCHCNM